MNKKLLLTSFVALGFACPAMAEPANTGEFPSGGLMQEDYTYTNAATETNMAGVYAGSVYANAQYEDVLYQIAAGKYLPAGAESVIDCDQNGYFCPGNSNGVNYSESNAQGLTQCPSGYANTANGASADTDCYRTCTNNDVAHSRGTVNGGVYYDGTGADGVNACTPTDCVDGWHVKPAVPDLTTAVGTGEAASRAYINGSDNFTEAIASYGQSFYGITSGDTNAFAVNYGNNGIIHGHAACSTTPGTANWSEPYSFSTESSITDQTGTEGAQYCWCHVDGYTPKDGTLQSVSSSWVFRSDRGSASVCASSCAGNCSLNLQGANSSDLAFRAAVLGTVGASPAMCEANTITINWNGTTQTEIDANEAGTATYGGNIRTPRSATHVNGKRFTGWRFSTTAPSNGDE